MHGYSSTTLCATIQKPAVPEIGFGQQSSSLFAIMVVAYDHKCDLQSLDTLQTQILLGLGQFLLSLSSDRLLRQ